MLLFTTRTVCALTLDAGLAVRSVNEDVATERADRTEEFFVADVIASRALVERVHARVWKVPLVAVVTQAPVL